MTAAGAGRVPVGRGTAGTLAGVALFLCAGALSRDPWIVPAAGAAAASLLLLALARWCRAFYGVADPPEVVLDEVAGIFLTFLGVASPDMGALAVGFIAFRAFDIVKPFPARQAERLPGGWGIVMDDLAAGLYANVCVRAWVAWGGANPP